MYAVMPSSLFWSSLFCLPYCQVKPTPDRPALQPCKRLFASFRCSQRSLLRSLRASALFRSLSSLSVADIYIRDYAYQQVSPFRRGGGGSRLVPLSWGTAGDAAAPKVVGDSLPAFLNGGNREGGRGVCVRKTSGHDCCANTPGGKTGARGAFRPSSRNSPGFFCIVAFLGIFFLVRVIILFLGNVSEVEGA